MIIERDSIETDCKELADNLRKPDFDEVVIISKEDPIKPITRGFRISKSVSYTHLRAHETLRYLVCPLVR